MELKFVENYKEFAVLKENRNSIDKKKFQSLKEAIKEKRYLICPIIVAPYRKDGDIGTLESFNTIWTPIVNDQSVKYIIIDGQHRLTVCRQLIDEGFDIEVPFFVNNLAYREDVVSANNSASPWSLTDYIKYNYSTNTPAYVQLVDVWKGSPIRNSMGNFELDGKFYGGIKRDKNNAWDQYFAPANIADAFYGKALSNGKKLTHTNAIKKGAYSIDLDKGHAILKTVRDLLKLDKDYKPSKLIRGIIYLYSMHPKTFDGEQLFSYIVTNGIKLKTRERQAIVNELLLEIFYSQHDRGLDNRNFSSIQREILKERDQICQCNTPLICEGDKSFEADHVQAWSEGGKTNISNGQWLCQPCNRSKGAGEWKR